MARGDYEARYGYDRETHRLILFKRQKGRCAICGEKFGRKWMESRYVTLDHRRPQSHGGGDQLANLDLAHKGCNRRKGADCEGCVQCDLTQIGWDDETL